MGMVELFLVCVAGIIILVLVAGGIIFFSSRKPTEKKICSACGAGNPVENRFCGQCGASLEQTSD